jgi:hypothetical protein
VNDGELRILAIVEQKLDALRRDFSDYRTESREHRDIIRDRLDEHSERDERQFAEIFRRLRPLEIAEGVQEHRDVQATTERAEGHAWRIALLTVLGLLASGAVGALFEHLWGR